MRDSQPVVSEGGFRIALQNLLELLDRLFPEPVPLQRESEFQPHPFGFRVSAHSGLDFG